MYYFFVEAIDDPHKEQPLTLADEQELCNALVRYPEQAPAPQSLTFHVDPRILQRDYTKIMGVSSGGFLCSQKFLMLLQEMQADIFTCPAVLKDLDGDQQLTSSHSFCVVPRYDHVIDWERSESWVETNELGGHYMTKLVLTEACEQKGIPIFRAELAVKILVHERVRTRIEHEKLIGIAFAPLSAIYTPQFGVRVFELERLLQKNQNNAKQWAELGALWGGLMRFQEALDAVEQALTLDPDLGRAWYVQGIILHRLGRQQEALEAFQRAIELHELPAWSFVSKLLRQLGRADEALAFVEGYRRSSLETGSLFWRELGENYSTLGRDEEALTAFERAILLGMQGEHASYGKGTILFRLGKYEEALEAYQAGLAPHFADHDPCERDLLRGEIQVLHMLGRDEEAAREEQKLQELEQKRAFRMQHMQM